MKRHILPASGFSLFELALAVSIFVIAICGVFSVFISSSTLAESGGNITVMMNRARQEIEDIIWTRNFDTLANYNLTVPAQQMSLACYVQNHNSVFCPDQNNVKEVRIVVSYAEKGDRIVGAGKHSRIIGEDANLNGSLDAGEDVNGDGRLSSPCEITTFVVRRPSD